MMIKSENKYRNTARQDADEAKLRELEAQNQPESKDKEPEAKTVEDESWKKRYSDLRSHTSKLETTLKKQISDLEDRISSSAIQEVKFPKTEAEVEEWAQKYPDIYKIFTTIALRHDKETAKVIDQRFERIKDAERLQEKQEAYRELLRRHPDFDDIRVTDQFREWLEDQDEWVYNALVHNETNAVAASRAVDLFKLDTGAKPKEKKKEDIDSMRAIRTPSGSPSEERNAQYSESRLQELRKKGRRAVEAEWPEFEKAINNGTFVYDISAGAR